MSEPGVCDTCEGSGELERYSPFTGRALVKPARCGPCDGTGLQRGMRFRVSDAACAALALDDKSVQDRYGLKSERLAKGATVYVGTEQAWRQVVEHAEARGGPGWDIGSGEVRACMALAARIRKALEDRA